LPPCGASSSARRSHAPDARVASANTARLAPRGRQRVRRRAGFAARRRARRGVTLPNCLAPSSRPDLAKAARSATPSPMLRPGSSTHLRRIRGPSKSRSESLRSPRWPRSWSDHLLRFESLPFGESELGVEGRHSGGSLAANREVGTNRASRAGTVPPATLAAPSSGLLTRGRVCCGAPGPAAHHRIALKGLANMSRASSRGAPTGPKSAVSVARCGPRADRRSPARTSAWSPPRG